jgi:arylsulfatase A-like enzyme
MLPHTIQGRCETARFTLAILSPLLGLTVAALTVGCAPATDPPPAVSLVQDFAHAEVTDSPKVQPEFPRLEWRFDGTSPLAPEGESDATVGWSALHDIRDLRVEDGLLLGTVGQVPILVAAIPEQAFPDDRLWAIELRLRISEGAKLGVETFRSEEIDEEELLQDIDDTGRLSYMIDLRPGEDITSYTLTEANATWSKMEAIGNLRYLTLWFGDADGADFALESLRVIPRTEHLARVPAGVGWHGLAGIFRETLVARAPERLAWHQDLGERPWLDLAIGTPETHPVTFRVEVTSPDCDPVVRIRTVTKANRWEKFAVELDELAGRPVTVSLSVDSEEEGRIGFWGSPAIRHRHAEPASTAPTAVRAELGPTGPPRGVILIVADTLRSDHLDAWGYHRPTAPNLAALAAGGTRFADNISQGSWTKVAVSSLLTSLYASSHGVYDIPHKIPASVTTLTEVFREAGYTTFHTSSVTFSGKNSNLHQGVEVLHERESIDDLGDYRSKTSRTYVDRLLPWLEDHQDQPFFVFLHVFDPHSPFRPMPPHDSRWLGHDAIALHEENLERVDDVVKVFHHLPSADQLVDASVDADTFVTAEKAWYDGSIRAMDYEIARLLERLQELGLRQDTLIAFVADHGEEFLEHGNHWHGHSAYGELVNVPMFVTWPGRVPAGLIIEETTQSIDLMPTLLELAQLPIPPSAQGESLLPLLAEPHDPASAGWGRRAVFTERKNPPGESTEGTADSFAVIADGWKLIWNVVVRDDRPEIELFDHRNDPLNRVNVADRHPQVVADLRSQLESWHEMVEAQKVGSEEAGAEIDPEELAQLRALGYAN